MANDCYPLYEDADRLTGNCTSPVKGKRFVAPSTGPLSGPGMPATAQVGASDPVDGANLSVAPIPGAKALGVSTWDAAENTKVGVITQGVVPITAGATVKVGELVGAGEGGQAVPIAAEGTSALLETGAANAGIIFRQVIAGKGELWKVVIAVAGANTAFKIVKAGKVITITLATNAGSEATTTAKEIVEKVNASAESNTAITAALKEGSTGTHVGEALAETALAGGTTPTVSCGMCVIGATAGNDAFVKLHC